MTRPRASRAVENAARRSGYVWVAGVDEVGRGCLAGPVVAAAVVLDADCYVHGIADSKTLSSAARERAFPRIVRAALSWHVATVDASEIDRLNIHRASLEAMRQAVMALHPQPEYVLVDGFAIPGLEIAQRRIVGGDRRCTAIAAASILAKVTRDRLMVEMHLRDPRYGFDRHKGYATSDHIEALGRFGYRANTAAVSGQRPLSAERSIKTPTPREMFIRFFSRLLVAAYLTDTGLLLMYSPWTIWWRQNFFAATWPWVGAVMATTSARVGVVLVGLLTTIAGLADLLQVLARRQAEREAATGSGPSPT